MFASTVVCSPESQLLPVTGLHKALCWGVPQQASKDKHVKWLLCLSFDFIKFLF